MSERVDSATETNNVVDLNARGGNDAIARAERLLERQKAACRADRIPTLAARKDRLTRLQKLIREYRDEFVKAVSEDFGGRSSMETEFAELTQLHLGIGHTKHHLAQWMRPTRSGVDISFQPASAHIRHEPLGVVGVIAPWNYPVLLALAPMADAFAAGNRVMLKPSEHSPATSALLARAIGEHFDEDEAAVVVGEVEVGAAFTSLPFDHLFFTGSTEIGRLVARAAAENLTPVTLELGGKSPAVICPDYDFKKAASSLSLGKYFNAGQTCIAPDYALVPKGRGRELADALIAKAEKAYPDLGDDDYTAVINDRQLKRLEAVIEEAETGGATVIRHSGKVPAGKLAPTVVLNAPQGGRLMGEEIFGPVLPIVEYDDLDHALALINDGERPLALYVFTGDKDQRERVLNGAISGGVTVNATMSHIAQHGLPFGGIGASGQGAYHGHHGFMQMSHKRAVVVSGVVNPLELMGPPWGSLARLSTRMMNVFRFRT